MAKNKPKTRWSKFEKTTSVQFSELAKHDRLDPTFYIAQNCLMQILSELRHDTLPNLDFMEAVDFILDHPALMKSMIKEFKH